MEQALAFLLAREADLPASPCDWDSLGQVQRLGVTGGTALRLYRLPPEHTIPLESLPIDGRIPSSRSGGPEAVALICDAVIPHLDVKSLWLGVYARAEGDTWRELDRFPLREAENETCWFYPTEDGRYLGWENQRRIETLPGFLPEKPFQDDAINYERGAVHVLWSLMADDLALTCVGLTFRGRRIEWPVISAQPEPFATWTGFQVDSGAESTYQENASITVFAD